MENEANSPKNETTQELALDNPSTSVISISDSKVTQQSGYLQNWLSRSPILQILIAVVGLLCLVFILGKLINQYDLTSVCISWSCVTMQNPDTCATKHLLSLGVGGAFGVLSGVGIALLLPAGAMIAPAIAGLLVGAGIFGISTFLLDFLIQC